jgi:hypothetical protein
VTELLGGNRRSVGRHFDACWPSSSGCSESSVASRVVYSHENRRAARGIKPKPCSLHHEFIVVTVVIDILCRDNKAEGMLALFRTCGDPSTSQSQPYLSEKVGPT